MNTHSSAQPLGLIKLSAALLFTAIVFCLLGNFTASAANLTITLKNAKTGADITTSADYRWTVEEDATKASVPGKPADTSNYSFSFHTSYMPVVAAGRRAGGNLQSTPSVDPDVVRLYTQSFPDLDANKRYYVSVAAVGYQMGGAPVVFSGGSANATVYLNPYDVPTAQVSVFAFNDNNPINGAPDLPQETGLAGFTVQLLEAGGTYGQSGGAVTQDAFANPLGTTYNADGSIKARGNGIILTGPDGTATIKNLFPAKYTVVIVPPVGSDWHQTSTIEGGKGQDAWVKNNEPSFFQEFGPPGHHVFIGFTKSGALVPGVLNGSNTVKGRIVNTHNSRPPIFTFYNAAPVNDCWVGLNEPNGGRALYATACDKQSRFSIPNVPNGTYELVIWDEPLDMIIGAATITVDSNLAEKDYPVTSWFGRYQGRVFQDIDGTGLPYFKEAFDRPYVYVNPVSGVEEVRQQAFAAGDLKPPLGAGVANNIRFRDGSIYQSVITKDDGTFAFTEVFPFFNYMVAEIDYARFKATSANVVVDDGGQVDPTGNLTKLWGKTRTTPYTGLFGSNDPALAYDPWTRLNPQEQAPGECPEGRDAPCYFRTESVGSGSGAILLEGMQTFLGQTNHIEWGKVPYRIDENGGIAGIVYYAITRAEDDPRYAAAENWEPGIPRVQVNVYLDCDGDGKPDQPKNDGSGLCNSLSSSGYQYVQPDVDNYPFCWRNPDNFAGSNPQLCPNGAVKGPEDVVRGGNGNVFSYGDVFRWGAPRTDALPNPGPDDQPEIGLGKTDSWDDSIPTGCPDKTPYTIPNTATTLDCYDGLRNFNQVRPSVFDGGYAFGRVAGQAELPMIIGAQGKGTYIIEAVAPPGYLHQGNGDKNVVFGDSLKATPAALPQECVGIELDVPQFLTLFPGEANSNYGSPQYPNNKWRKCDMKAVPLLPGMNAAPNFFMYTEAPVAGHGVGFILDDTSAEFNHFAPNFGEKYAPPHMPISIQDWTGREISRVYSDQFGSYNFLVPSSFTINPPFPSGVMPSMMVACMNHPGPISKDPVTGVAYATPQIDPYFNRGYTQFCYTLQYLAGKTTYLDTPVVPVAAFAAVDKNPLDCECADGTPAIYSVNNQTDNGPWVPSSGNRVLTIVSMGKRDVVNPAFDPSVDPVANPTDPRTKRTILRDYGFGSTPGSITLGSTALTGVSWSDGAITATVPSGASTGQLTIKRGDNGKESVVGVTVHVGGSSPKKVNPNATAGSGVFRTIQEAIDAPSTGAGDLITIAPGTYNEYVIMDKRVRLQGWGAGSTFVNAAKSSAGGLADWRTKINSRANNTFTLLPGQTLGIDTANNEPLLFGAEEGPGILVVGRSGSNNGCNGNQALSIDGLTITGSDAGGGILASGYACSLQVSNNRVVSNYGTYGGGIRIGHTVLVAGDGTFTDAVNPAPNIHHNWVAQNGATEAGGGGGITLGTGSNSYNVDRNYICGNFSMADGGGLSHLGLSTGSVSSNNSSTDANRISNNKFIFNQTFNQSADPTGGGLSIAAQIPPGGVTATGTGDVVIDANLFQGNQAGAGAGGGVSIARTLNGDDINFTNNMIVNNVAAYTGGGVALTDIGSGVHLINNTIASNVSTATNRQAFDGNSPQVGSKPQIAGLSLLSGTSPLLLNNIVWGNRSFIYLISGTTTGLFNPGTTDVNAPVATKQYRDLSPSLAPRYSVLTTGGIGNAAYDTGLTGCSNTAPTPSTSSARNAIRCNRLEPADSATLFVKANDFTSIIDPTQPVALQDQTVSLQSALTFDETGNFINVIFTPLTLWVTTPGTDFGILRADYHITPTSAAKNNGRDRNTSTNGNTGATNTVIGANLVPTVDIDADARGAGVDIGADENLVLIPTLTSITPSSGGQGATNLVVNFVGTNLNGATAVTVSGADVTCGVTASTATTLAASCNIGAGAALGARNVSVTTPIGTSGTVTFTINPAQPTLTAINPGSGARPTTGSLNYTVTLAGTNLTGATLTEGSSNFSIVSYTVDSATQITATLNVQSGTSTGNKQLTATTAGGSANINFNVVGLALSSIAPNAGVRGTVVPVTLTGAGLNGATSVTISGSGVTAGAITVNPAGTSLTTSLTIAGGTTAATGNRNVAVVTPAGTTGNVTFAVQGPTLASISPTSSTTAQRGTNVSVTLTGTNLTGATALTVSGAGVTVNSFTVVNSTTITASLAISAGTTNTGAKNVAVVTPIGTTGNVTFTKN